MKLLFKGIVKKKESLCKFYLVLNLNLKWYDITKFTIVALIFFST